MAAWKVLEEMITDFRKRGVTVPADVISNLRYAKTLINVLKADPSRVDTGQKVEEHLRSVESYLVSKGQESFGAGYAEEWLKRLDEASKKVLEEEEETRFISGLPREQKWIRVKPFAELPSEKLKALADELSLSYNVQNDGCLLVYGKDERIKDFVKKMATKYGLKAEK
ncbi:MAG: DUF2096 domain-containing protein [Candidatus Bathyarchaeota archaeon]|nr:DUF2096 domain-containing protein [Candidatus Bathyarchaeota archaeon]